MLYCFCLVWWVFGAHKIRSPEFKRGRLQHALISCALQLSVCMVLSTSQMSEDRQQAMCGTLPRSRMANYSWLALAIEIRCQSEVVSVFCEKSTRCHRGVEHAPAQLTGVCKLYSPEIGNFMLFPVTCDSLMQEQNQNAKDVPGTKSFRNCKTGSWPGFWKRLAFGDCKVRNRLVYPGGVCVLLESCGNVDLGLVKCDSNWIHRNHLSLNESNGWMTLISRSEVSITQGQPATMGLLDGEMNCVGWYNVCLTDQTFRYT